MAIKNWLNLFFHMDFFDNHKPVTKLLYFLYTLLAGMYYESYVRQWFRYCTKMYFIAAAIDIFRNFSITFSKCKTIDTSLVLLSGTTLIAVPCVCLIILMNYYWHENIYKSFKIIDEYVESYEDYNTEIVWEDEKSYTTIDYNKYLKFHRIFPLSLLFILCLYGKLIVVCLTLEESSDINPLYNYTYPVPYLAHVNWLEYVLIYFLQTVFLLLFCIIAFTSMINPLLFLIIIRNQVILLIKEIKFESNLITKSLDDLYEQEIKILKAKTSFENKSFKLRSIFISKQTCYEKFINHTKKWIFRHQKLFAAMHLLKGYLEAISSLDLVCQTSTCMSLGYISVMASGTKSIEYLPYVMLVIPGMFMVCMSGHLYDNMMEELANEIYAMPWYYLPSTERKLILNFLSIVQTPCTMKAFKVYPMTLSLYPRILMKIFSYLQIIRVVVAQLRT